MSLSLAKSEDELAREAAEWEARLGREPVRDADLAAFDDWLAQSPDHATAFADLQVRLAELEDAAGLEKADALLAEARAYREPRSHSAPGGIPVWGWSAIAAALLVSLVSLGLISAGLLGPAGSEPSSGTQIAVGDGQTLDLATSVGEIRAVTLADGSMVTLDTASQLDVRLTQDRRSLVLAQGRAHFGVAHDTARPFVVTAAGYDVVATGTAFDVRLEAGQLQVTLLEGAVEIRPSGLPAEGTQPVLTLRPGQRWTQPADGPSSLVDAALAHAGVWREGRIELEDRPLEDAVAEFNRYLDAPILIQDPALGALPVSGQFRTADTASFLDAVTALYGLEQQPRQDGSVLLLPGENTPL